MKNKIVRWWNSEQGINLTAHIIFFTPVFFMLWGVFYCLPVAIPWWFESTRPHQPFLESLFR